MSRFAVQTLLTIQLILSLILAALNKAFVLEMDIGVKLLVVLSVAESFIYGMDSWNINRKNNRKV